MKKFLKFGAFITITGVLFFVVCTVAFYYLVRVGEFRSFLIDEIEKNSALKVGLGAADLEIGWVTGVGFRDVAIAMPESAVPEIAAERITARVALLPLLQRKIIFYEIRLQRPTVALIGDADGRPPLTSRTANRPSFKLTRPETPRNGNVSRAARLPETSYNSMSNQSCLPMPVCASRRSSPRVALTPAPLRSIWPA